MFILSCLLDFLPVARMNSGYRKCLPNGQFAFVDFGAGKLILK